MKQAPLEHDVTEMVAQFPGVRGCALVDAASGLVWYRFPDRELDALWEASIDHWRLQERLGKHFSSLGTATSIATYHTGGVLALLPCMRDPDLLMVCLADYKKMDWGRWQSESEALGARIRIGLQTPS